MRRTIWLIGLLLWVGSPAVRAQEPPDSMRVPPTADTLISVDKTIYVIPAGPVAGTFSPASRLSVVDTVAGWAKIVLEGWVPVGDVLGRMGAAPLDQAGFETTKPAVRQRCVAVTSKGKRCKRKSEPGSDRCWQHQD
ncbi:MAG: hypothetical protein IPK53_02640 [bacterium]|nr:hypothetical protein [bacterium]MBK8127863.1 hypothetical protein [bacterium]